MSSDKVVARRRARPLIERHSYLEPEYKGRAGGGFIVAFLCAALLALVVVFGFLYWSLHRSQGASARPLTFRVGTGDTVTTVADRLQSTHLIDNALLFRLDARLQDLAGKLKVGDYVLRRNMSIDGMVGALQVYTASNVRLTIREGLRKEEVGTLLGIDGINSKSFLREVERPTFTASILADRPAGTTLEGYLFPNTYNVPPHYGGAEFAALMVRTLDRNFTSAMRAEARRDGFSVYQVLTLASIVEREARAPRERPLIASVYENRLRVGMFLDADPTVQYALGVSGHWWPLLRTDQLRTPSPYNTYIHRGLPPGPIANPGLASIKATLSPARTDYYYFVAKGKTGYHAFARTYAQQLQNQAKYDHVP